MIDIKTEKDKIAIKFPKDLVSNKVIEKFINRLELEELAKKNKMTDKQAEEIAKDINSEWWNNNKDSFLNGIS